MFIKHIFQTKCIVQFEVIVKYFLLGLVLSVFKIGTAQDLDSSKLNDELEFAGYYAAVEKRCFSEPVLHEDYTIIKTNKEQVDAVENSEDEDSMSTPEQQFNQVLAWVGVIVGIFAIFLVAQWIINRRLNSLLSARMSEINTHNEELKKMNSELDNFVYRVSHDLRAPISSSLGLLNLIERESYGNFEEYHQLIRKSLLKLDDFIIDILHYSRNSRLEIIEETIDINELIDEVIESVGHQSTKIRVEKDVNNCDFYAGDRGRIAIVLNNLIANAFRYGDLQKDDPYVMITASCDGDHLEITIRDNGIGIGVEHLPKVFDMFYRAHHERTGSGLGLYIVREVMDKLNGTIDIESEIEKGTTVRVNIYRK